MVKRTVICPSGAHVTQRNYDGSYECNCPILAEDAAIVLLKQILKEWDAHGGITSETLARARSAS